MSDTPRTDALKFRGGGDDIVVADVARGLERELNAEKTKVYSAWVDMERIGNELEIPLEELSPDAIVTAIANMKSDLSTINAERQETKALRQAWIECDNKRQELKREVNILKLEIQKFE